MLVLESCLGGEVVKNKRKTLWHLFANKYIGKIQTPCKHNVFALIVYAEKVFSS
jgi:hypothetical protein